jgi:hypothetical protein
MLLSCEPPAVVDLPEPAPKLVINCVSQDTRLWRCSVSASKGILEFLPFEPVSNASIDLYSNQQLIESWTLINNFDKGLYGSKTLTPIPGETYTIIAHAESFPTVTSTYTHPTTVPITALVVHFLGPSPTGESSTNIQLDVEFTDPAGQNYYAVLARRKSEDSQFPPAAAALALSFVDPSYRENSQIFFETIIFTDQFFDGKKVTMGFNSIIYEVPGDPDLPYYTVSLMNLSKEYFDYLKTSNLQSISQRDPFAQPVKVHTNIDHGLGVFGGFSETEKTTHAPR